MPFVGRTYEYYILAVHKVTTGLYSESWRRCVSTALP